jgi:hypothetical protein
MFIHTPSGPTRLDPSSPLTSPILEYIRSSGGKTGDWFCSTSMDAEEQLAHLGVYRLGDWIWVECNTYSAALTLKSALSKAGVYCGSDGQRRGGSQVYCYRVTLWNCWSLPFKHADWVYQSPLKVNRFRH